jgi:hypothetical protein
MYLPPCGGAEGRGETRGSTTVGPAGQRGQPHTRHLPKPP